MEAKFATNGSPGHRWDPGRLARYMQPVCDALNHAAAEQNQRDPFRRDPRFVREYLPYFKAFALYFGTEIRGWENLPAEGPFLILGNHSGGLDAELRGLAAELAHPRHPRPEQLALLRGREDVAIGEAYTTGQLASVAQLVEDDAAFMSTARQFAGLGRGPCSSRSWTELALSRMSPSPRSIRITGRRSRRRILRSIGSNTRLEQT